MRLDEDAALKELRRELRAYFASVMTSEERSQHKVSPERVAEINRRLGTDGWLGIGWPAEFGGQGRSQWEQFVFFDEAKRAGIPVPMLALNTVGPTIMKFGTDEQKAKYLPEILAGRLQFAIGYTEPEAGTDLASMKTRAVREGGVFRINGTKVFTTGGRQADYIWLAARTDPEAAKHRGLSVFIVPTTSEGFSVAPLPTIAEDGAKETTVTYYTDVIVPASNLVGTINDGWNLITAQLNYERVALAANLGWLFELIDDIKTYFSDRGAKPEDWALAILATIDAQMEAARLLNWRMVGRLASGEAIPPGEAAAAKVYGSELAIEVCRMLMEVLGRSSYLTRDSAGAVLSGRLEEGYRATVVTTFGGGNSEILREMIAYRELGMLRAPR